MTETQMVHDTWIRPGRAEAETTSQPDRPRPPHRASRPHRLPGRAIARLRGLLHAQALLNGTADGRNDVAFIEDDRGRLSARQAR
jgi:hypothetical protein